jgi:flagellar hook-basal body complex protein FliE
MLGGLGKLTSSLGKLGGMAAGISGISGIMQGINTAMSAISKVAEAAKSATGADKAGLDKKLGELTNQVGQGLQQAQQLAQNAAAGGNPIAGQVMASITQASQALASVQAQIPGGSQNA